MDAYGPQVTKKTDRVKPDPETHNCHHKTTGVERGLRGETDEQRPEERPVMFSTNKDKPFRMRLPNKLLN
jgi:hypothetical protein